MSGDDLRGGGRDGDADRGGHAGRGRRLVALARREFRSSPARSTSRPCRRAVSAIKTRRRSSSPPASAILGQPDPRSRHRLADAAARAPLSFACALVFDAPSSRIAATAHRIRRAPCYGVGGGRHSGRCAGQPVVRHRVRADRPRSDSRRRSVRDAGVPARLAARRRRRRAGRALLLCRAPGVELDVLGQSAEARRRRRAPP